MPDDIGNISRGDETELERTGLLKTHFVLTPGEMGIPLLSDNPTELRTRWLHAKIRSSHDIIALLLMPYMRNAAYVESLPTEEMRNAARWIVGNRSGLYEVWSRGVTEADLRDTSVTVTRSGTLSLPNREAFFALVLDVCQVFGLDAGLATIVLLNNFRLKSEIVDPTIVASFAKDVLFNAATVVSGGIIQVAGRREKIVASERRLYHLVRAVHFLSYQGTPSSIDPDVVSSLADDMRLTPSVVYHLLNVVSVMDLEARNGSLHEYFD